MRSCSIETSRLNNSNITTKVHLHSGKLSIAQNNYYDFHIHSAIPGMCIVHIVLITYWWHYWWLYSMLIENEIYKSLLLDWIRLCHQIIGFRKFKCTDVQTNYNTPFFMPRIALPNLLVHVAEWYNFYRDSRSKPEASWY